MIDDDASEEAFIKDDKSMYISSRRSSFAEGFFMLSEVHGFE